MPCASSFGILRRNRDYVFGKVDVFPTKSADFSRSDSSPEHQGERDNTFARKIAFCAFVKLANFGERERDNLFFSYAFLGDLRDWVFVSKFFSDSEVEKPV